MKQLYSLFIVLALSISAFGNGVEIEGIYYLLDSENHTATVTYPNETVPSWPNTPSTYTGTIIIPESVVADNQTYTVTTIGAKAFLGTHLTSISLPNTITSIEADAFLDHRGITTLELPNLQTIGNQAFRFCASLQKVVLPECITSLGSTVFQRCVGMTEIQLPQSLTSLPYAFLYACSGLTEVVLPPNITYISNECFTSCASLRSISLPERVKSIHYQAFKGTLSLEKFYIPKNVTSLGDEILEGYPQDPYTGGAVPQAPGSSHLKSVFIDCVTPPSCTGTNKTPFLRVDKSKVRLFVPLESVETYKSIPSYADYFKGIYAFGTEISNVMDITDSSALITWFPFEGVVQYTIDVYTGGSQLAHFLVDGEGNIISSQRYMPSVVQHKLDTTYSSTDYFVVSMDDLEPGTNYNYTINGTNENSEQIYHTSGSFSTTNAEDISNILGIDPKKNRKLLRDGQILIIRGDKTYNAQGQIVK